MINRLQRLQNAATRLVTRSPKRCHITPVLFELQWLPIYKRIEYKMLVYVYKALNGKAPEYISELVQFYSPGRSLRSTEAGILHVPKRRLRTFGDHSFSPIAPKLWNSLPDYIRNAKSVDLFKSML